ncbi:Coiled-coil domain-containing protein lobo homolog, related [Eimeria acervulina]|uniref:Coiled-coil domain-containing protein lobo homolog, related n=1 Tax=Eimeria acervulina TaxID=5801 RepID=U6GVP5_EIMAC|nr:Coiled-coil domain-containing protein lobo homolog, related [Eimeria acervulina]CDI83647.1 Coiled-coil domain-containing protein lobo homolog, related [Eimeria acervulina]
MTAHLNVHRNTRKEFKTPPGEDASGFQIELPKPLRYEELEKLAEERKREREAMASLSFSSEEGAARASAAAAAAAAEAAAEAAAKDPLKNKRIHCWALVKAGTRNVSTDLFIDPPSGRIYEQSKSPFLSVHFLWNQENFWVNMRPKLSAQELKFSLSNSRFFECALCMPPKPEARETQLAEFGSDQKTQHLNVG